MSDIIATIWDFDKTLISGYMQEPLFAEYNIDSKEFWAENKKRIKALEKSGLMVNPDTFYLNILLQYVREGKLKGLNNEKLKTYGNKQEFFPGVLELFEYICDLPKKDPRYQEEGIIFENYIVSSGLKKIIEGSPLMKFVKNVWGCEFSESKNPLTGKLEISDIAYSIDNTTKTRALFEINKGVNIKDLNIDVNTALPEDKRRIHFPNMIYIADGPSDIPAFSVINQKQGSTFAVYPRGKSDSMNQIDKMRADGRIQMYAEADFTKDSTAYMWITSKLKSKADAIIQNRKKAYQIYGKGTPDHLV